MATKDESRTLSVRILDKEYQVSCPEDDEASLLESSRYLDEKMRTIRASGRTIGAERIAVMAALNICHELMQTNQELEKTTRHSREQLIKLMEKVDTALDKVTV